jgi:hypothetical protein
MLDAVSILLDGGPRAGPRWLPERWDTALAAFNNLASAKDDDRAGALSVLGSLLRGGASAARTQAATWDELRQLLQEKCRLATAEARRLGDLQQNLTQQQALTLVQYIVEAVRQHVHDRETLVAIQQSLTPLPCDHRHALAEIDRE